MSSVTKFYVEEPSGEKWLHSFPLYVIKAEEKDIHKPLGDRSLKVLEPSIFAENWPSGFERCYWLECSGPVRTLTEDEYIELVHQLLPQRSLPGWYKSRSKEVFDNVLLSSQY